MKNPFGKTDCRWHADVRHRIRHGRAAADEPAKAPAATVLAQAATEPAAAAPTAAAPAAAAAAAPAAAAAAAAAAPVPNKGDTAWMTSPRSWSS